MGNFNHPSIYKRDSTVGHRQSWRPLQYISFFIQMTEKRCSLDLLLTNKEGLTVDVRVKGSSDNEMVEFGVLKGGRRVKRKPCTSGQQIVAFPKGRVPWNKAPEERVAQES